MRPAKAGTYFLTVAILFGCHAPNENTTDGKLLVVNKLADTAYLINIQTRDILKEFATGSEPHEVAVSDDKNLAAISNYKGSSVTIISLKTYMQHEILLKQGAKPHGIAFIPGTSKLLVTAEGLGQILMVDAVEKSVDKVLKTKKLKPEQVIIDAKGKTAYISNYESGTITKIAIENWKTLKSVTVGEGAEGQAITPNDKELWVTGREENKVTVVDLETMQVITKLTTGDQPVRIAITPEGKYAIVVNSISNTLQVFDVAAKHLVKTVNLKYQPEWLFDLLNHTPHPVGIAVHPNGNFAYITASNADEVFVFDLSKMIIEGTIPAGNLPDGIACIGFE